MRDYVLAKLSEDYAKGNVGACHQTYINKNN